MAALNSATAEREKKTNWIAWALTVVVVYIAGVLWLLGPQKIWMFLNGRTDLNSVGDFFAGIFAFPAFVLLIAAVMTQREEINSAREQFEKTGQLQDEQLALIKAQNEALALQNARSDESSVRNYRLNLFDKRFAIYEELVQFGERTNGKFSDDDLEQMVRISFKCEFVYPPEVAAWLPTIANVLLEYRQAYFFWMRTWWINEAGVTVPSTEPQHVAEAVRLRQQADWLKNQLSKAEIARRLGPSLVVTDTVS